VVNVGTKIVLIALLFFHIEATCYAQSFSSCFTCKNPIRGSRNYFLLPTDSHIYSGKRYRVESLLRGDTYTRNRKLIDTLARESNYDAFQIWYRAVSGGRRTQIAPIDKLRTHATVWGADWDYWAMSVYDVTKTDIPLGGVSEEVEMLTAPAAAAGNTNYAVTGVKLWTKIFADVGLEGPIWDNVIRGILKVGAASREFGDSDTYVKLFGEREGDWTWYLDDAKGAEAIEDGFRYSRYLDLQEAANVANIRLDPEAFGLSSIANDDLKYDLDYLRTWDSDFAIPKNEE